MRFRLTPRSFTLYDPYQYRHTSSNSLGISWYFADLGANNG